MKMIKNIIIHTIVLFSFLTAAESEQVENKKYSFIKEIYSQSWALVIGINAYQNVEPLNYAVNDAVAVKEMLVEKYGFKETNIRLILDEEATKDNILAGFSDILAKAREKDRVVVFYAGHGETYKLPSGGDMGYLIPVDGNLDNLYLSSIPMKSVYDIADMSYAKHILYLVDACYGGLTLATTRGMKKDNTPEYIKKMTKERGRQVITAGGKGEQVIEKSEWGHSAFTKSLLNGLGEGYADENLDGIITADELGGFIKNRVIVDVDGAHTPQKGRIGSDMGEFVFIYSENTIINTPSESASEKKMDLILDKLEDLENKMSGSASDSLNKPIDWVVTVDGRSLNTDEPTNVAEDEKTITIDNLVEELKKLGVEIDSEKIEKVSEKVPLLDNTKDSLTFNSTFSKSPTWHFGNNDAAPFWIRYNRSEGFYLQLNEVFQSEKIPGSSLYGGIGRAFHRNDYQWTIGLEQLIWKNTFQFYFEAFDKSITQDAWRVWDGENSMAAFFLKKDYLDWYSAQGFRGAGFIHFNNYFSIGAEYNQIAQKPMKTVLEGDDFRTSYTIEEGDDYYLKTIFSLGYPVDIAVRDELQFYSTLTRRASVGSSKFNYTRDHLFLNLLAPYTDDLSFELKLLAGASNVEKTIWEGDGYHQHVFEIGGKGTLRGYEWKELTSAHYQLTNLEVWYDWVGFIYDRAVLFDSPGNTFNSDFFSDLSNDFTKDVHQSAGISIGDEDFQISFYRRLKGDNQTVIYLTFGTPLPY
jgi:hypothetical protein